MTLFYFTQSRRPIGQVCLAMLLILIAPYLPIIEASVRKFGSSKNTEVSFERPLKMERQKSLYDLSEVHTVPEKTSISIHVDRNAGELELAIKIIAAIDELEKTQQLPESALGFRAALRAGLEEKNSPLCILPAVLLFFGIVVAAETIVEVIFFTTVVVVVVVLAVMAIEEYSDDVADAIRAELDALWAELAALEQLLADCTATGFWYEVDLILDQIAAKWVEIYDALGRLHEHFFPGSGATNFMGVVAYYDSNYGFGSGPGLGAGLGVGLATAP